MRKILVLLIVAVLAVIGGQTAIAFDHTSGEDKYSGEDTNPYAGDTTSPSYYEVEGEAEITITTPSDGDIYESGQVVIANYECTEADGTVLPPERCRGTVPDGQRIDTSDPGYYSFRVESADADGYYFSSTHSYEVKGEAEVTIRTPEDGDMYDRDQEVIADYECTEADGTALPPERCKGPVDDGERIDTSDLGYYSFRVNAADGNGDSFWLTNGYEVVEDAPGTTGNGEDSGAETEDSGTETGEGDTTINVFDSVGDTTNNIVHKMGDTTNNIVYRTGDTVTYVGGRVENTRTYIVDRTGDTRTYVVDRTRYVGAICGGSMVDAVGGIRQGRLPETGGGWIALLLSGTTLVGGGLFLVRRFSR